MSAVHLGVRGWRALSLVEVAVLAALLGALVVQHYRHGWPFSSHHGASAAPDVANPHAVHSATTRAPAVGPHAGHGVEGRVAVNIPHDRQATVGVRLVAAAEGEVGRDLRAVATVALDESRVSHVHTRVAGWIERLYVNTTGQRVERGAPLASIFSQELLASQNEYLSLRQGLAAMSTPDTRRLLTAARGRLQVFGMTGAEIDAIERSGRAIRTVTVVAPRSGVVIHRGIVVGTAVDPSTEIVTVADLSRVWVQAEVPETESSAVRVGARARLMFPALPPEGLAVPVEFILPTVDERTRTVRVRFAVANESGALRPGMYGSAVLETGVRRALVVPRDAVVDTGGSQHVFVAGAGGIFMPRRVVIGTALEDRVEVREGLTAGERVVASGVFLIDSESRLRASGQGGSQGGGHSGHGS